MCTCRAAALSVGDGDGWAAIVPTGAASVNRSRTTWSQINSFQTRKERRSAADGPSIDPLLPCPNGSTTRPLRCARSVGGNPPGMNAPGQSDRR